MSRKFITTISEVLPLVSFFFFYKFYGIIAATSAIVVSTIICVAINYWQTRYISKISIISTAIISVFGLITIISKDTTFIKIKPTIINAIFAAILIFGLLRNKSYLKPVLGHALNITEKAWLELTKRFALFCIFMALLNEVMWRFFSEATWVGFKVFGIIGLSLLFMLSQAPFINRNSIAGK